MAKADSARAKKIKAKKKKIEKLYEKKPMIEFIVAILSIPSILLLLILNFKSLTSINNAKPIPTPGSTTSATGFTPNFFARPVNRGLQATVPPNETQPPCTKGLGPASITTPHEGDTVDIN